MSLVQALVLGIVQGLTEFLPVSSSGHLIIVRWLFGWDLGTAAVEKGFDAAIHLGTALAAIVLLQSDIAKMARSFLVRRRDDESRLYFQLAILSVLASIPAGVAGFLGESVVEEKLGSVVLVAIQLALFGAVLLVTDRLSSKRRSLSEIGIADAAVIGLAQVLSLSPGVSRSGITMTAALGRGLDRAAATRFSFLLLVPVTAGAGAFKSASVLADPATAVLAMPFLVGIVTSAVTGYAAARALLALVRTRSFFPFVAYRFAASAVVIALVWLRGY